MSESLAMPQAPPESEGRSSILICFIVVEIVQNLVYWKKCLLKILKILEILDILTVWQSSIRSCYITSEKRCVQVLWLVSQDPKIKSGLINNPQCCILTGISDTTVHRGKILLLYSHICPKCTSLNALEILGDFFNRMLERACVFTWFHFPWSQMMLVSQSTKRGWKG